MEYNKELSADLLVELWIVPFVERHLLCYISKVKYASRFRFIVSMTATTSSTSKYLDLNPLVPLQIPSNLSWTDAEKSQLSILYPSVDVRARIVVQYLLDVRLWLHFLVTERALISAHTCSSAIHCLNFFRRKELMASSNYSRFGPCVPEYKSIIFD